MSLSIGTRGSLEAAKPSPGEIVEGRFGFGRLIKIDGQCATVEYFDHPGDGGTITEVEPGEDVRRAVLTPQTRVHWRRGGHWNHGRVIEHRREDARVLVRSPKQTESILTEAELVVRWRRRLSDASTLLADGWLESRRYFDARQAFVPEYLKRESLYQGLTALASSAIEVHPHQVEAVRRVITDVRPRYLLADEVGLGKTIEAGLLIRQHLLDRRDTTVVVAVPDALATQWCDEMDSKFHISEQFPARCHIVGHSELIAGAAERVPSLLVVDEAHRLARNDNESYRILLSASRQARGVLLLSATPLLEDSASLLRMLHLLSPEVHKLDELEEFQRALTSRDDIASLFGNLTEDSPPLFLRSAVEGLREVLTEDRVLADLLDDVEAALVDCDEGGRARAIRRARSHVAEVHRVHNRMIRTRRDVGLAEEFPVLGRVAPRVEPLDGALADLDLPFTTWREWIWSQADLAAGEQERRQVMAQALPIVEALSSSGPTLSRAVRGRLAGGDAQGLDPEEAALLSAIEKPALVREEACPRIAATVAYAAAARESGARVAVVAGTEEAADAIETALKSRVRESVLRISTANPLATREFEEAPDGSVLIFGPVGEEGQNLQAADVVVHADLPWDPNRLEQRLGRFDRFAAGTPCEHVVFRDDVDTPANAWLDLLNSGFGIFTGSIASLQEANERLKGRIEETVVLGSPTDLRELDNWVAQELEQELGAVEIAEVLDETVLDDRGRELLEGIDIAESSVETQKWRDAVVRWASGDGSTAAHLRFHHQEGSDQERGQDTFRLTRYEMPNVNSLTDSDLPLVPWSELDSRFAGSMPNAEASGTFRRHTATHRHLRLLGPGDPFIDALWEFTEMDDRGHAFALWRAREFWSRDEAIFTCFDLRIRPDIGLAIESTGRPAADVEAALRRRAQSYLPPVFERVWLDVDGEQVGDESLLKLLNAPYADNRGDQTLRPPMWHRLHDHVPADRWADWCTAQRQHAQALVKARNDLDHRCKEAAHRASEDVDDQVARLSVRDHKEGRSEADLERSIGEALAEGLRNPESEVDAMGIVVLSHAVLPDEGES